MKENWFLSDDGVRRHRKSKMFAGKIVELQVAEWIETRGYKVAGLEALGCGFDVIADKEHGPTTAFEVKAIGLADEDWNAINQSSSGAYSIVPTANYLLFRVYEAAKQLDSFEHHRVVIVVLNDEWVTYKFDLMLSEQRIDWQAPSFIEDEDQSWIEFIDKQLSKHPQLPADIPSVIGGIDEVWVCRQKSDYSLSLIDCYVTRIA